jgi:hypothetical protein
MQYYNITICRLQVHVYGNISKLSCISSINEILISFTIVETNTYIRKGTVWRFILCETSV